MKDVLHASNRSDWKPEMIQYGANVTCLGHHKDVEEWVAPPSAKESCRVAGFTAGAIDNNLSNPSPLLNQCIKNKGDFEAFCLGYDDGASSR